MPPTRRRSSPAGGRWRRGSSATSNRRARRWPTASWPRGPSSGASSPSSTTSSPARSRIGRSRSPPGTSPAISRRPWPRRFDADLPAVVADEIRPAFARYRAFLADELAPVARADDRPGLGSVPGGDAAYARLIRAHTTLDLTPETIHRIGLAETERIDGEFAELGGRLLGTADRHEGDRAAPIGPGAPLRHVGGGVRRRRGFAGPGQRRDPGLVRPPPEGSLRRRRDGRPRGPPLDDRLLPPARRGRQPAGQLLHQHVAPETRPRYEAEALAFHEAVPGHHLQIAIAQELDGLPAFRRLAGVDRVRRGLGPVHASACRTRWACTPATSTGSGSCRSTPGAPCRLVVDTGHARDGLDPRSRRSPSCSTHTALAENNIVNEVDRYIVWPGQALAYKIGQLEMLRLARAPGAALGAAFDIRGLPRRRPGPGRPAACGRLRRSSRSGSRPRLACPR